MNSLLIVTLCFFAILACKFNHDYKKGMRTEKTSIQSYIETHFVKPDPRKETIIAELQNFNKEGINVSPAEGKLLKVLTQMVKAKTVIEIGTLFGYSTSWFLEAVGETGQVWSFEFSEEHYNKARTLLKEDIASGRLQIILGQALEELPKIEKQGPFDLVFIDANKSGYMDYFKWADANLKSGGLIIADNTFLFGTVLEDAPPENNKKAWQVMRELNHTLGQSDKYESIMIPTAEGMTIAFKK